MPSWLGTRATRQGQPGRPTSPIALSLARIRPRTIASPPHGCHSATPPKEEANHLTPPPALLHYDEPSFAPTRPGRSKHTTPPNHPTAPHNHLEPMRSLVGLKPEPARSRQAHSHLLEEVDCTLRGNVLQGNLVAICNGGHAAPGTHGLVTPIEDWKFARRRGTKRLPGNENDARIRRVENRNQLRHHKLRIPLAKP